MYQVYTTDDLEKAKKMAETRNGTLAVIKNGDKPDKYRVTYYSD